ncbi:MAG: hypothetical protein ACJ76F_05425, partial [Bacteroidia bacterium]
MCLSRIIKFRLFLLSGFISCISFSQNTGNLVGPCNNFVTADTNIVFTWSPVQNNSSFDFELSKDSLFSSSVISSPGLAATSLIASDLDTGRYYWHVRRSGGAAGPWTAFFTFKIIALKGSLLQLWWDAGKNITKDVNGFVSAWGDQSGNTHDGIQSNAIEQPLFKDSMINNLPVLRFDGNTQSIRAVPFTLNPPATLFMFYTKKVSGQNEYMFDGNGPDQFRLSVDGGNHYLLYAGNFCDGGDAGPNGYKIFSLRQKGAGSFIRSNFVKTGTGNPGASPIGGFSLGSYGSIGINPVVHAEMDVAEVLIYNDTLSISSTIDIENYLRFKYAPPVTLGKDIVSTSSFCPVVLSPQIDYTTYLWNTGAVTRNISVNSNGKYWVNVTDSSGFSSSDTINVFFPSIPAIQDSITFCAGDSLIWDTGYGSSLFTFDWQDNSTDSLFIIKQSGTYFVTLTDTGGCFMRSDTITSFSDNYSSTVSLGNDTSLCAGNAISLAQGATNTVSYLWNDNSTNASLSINLGGTYWVTTQ